MKRIFSSYVWVAVVLAALATASVSAQDGIVSIRSVSNLISGDTIQAGQNVRIVINFNNTVALRVDCANGYRLSSPDGATWDSTTIDSIGPINDGGTPGDPSDDFSTYFMNRWSVVGAFGEFSCDGIGADTVSFLGAGANNVASKKLPATWNDSVYAITAWFSNASAHGKRICIDTSFYQPGGTWVWVDINSVDHHPPFNGLPGQSYTAGSGYCFRIWDPVQGVDGTEGPTLPKQFALQQNYPNPFNPTTIIKFDVPRRSAIKLSVFNVLGQKVKTLIDGVKDADSYEIQWDGTSDGGSSVSTGIYFYKMEAGSFVQTKKMVLMK